ncbi:ABC1 kinase family protein [Streptomyces sp. NPDC093225]|uniref:ABC1 kinase family protein n=1 Tax=Streptomyces sp. NPDC093225 TaxID=3366034 RepID=UPI0038105CDC
MPLSALARGARLAALPLGFAGRSAVRAGKLLAGQPAELLTEELQRRTSRHLFRVLGELKGGAMKFGQMLSVFEAALPAEAMGPYRAALTLLQEAAPALPAEQVHRVLAAELGPDWRTAFQSFEDEPAAAASIGQVHRAIWGDGRPVAVKIQYPGAGEALLGDYANLGRAVKVCSVIAPGLDVQPMLDELRERVAEELDYRREAAAQQAFAEAYRGSGEVVVPDVVAATERVLVTEWLDGTPLSRVVRDGAPAERDAAGLAYVRFLLSGPSRAGYLHADVHPGNFRMLPDGRLGAIDFGAVKELPDGFPPAMGRLVRLALAEDWEGARAVLVREGFLRPDARLDEDVLRAFLTPIAEPARAERHRFSREWLRAQVANAAGAHRTALLRSLNLPPSYVLVNRVVGSAVAVLAQLDCTLPFRAELLRWLPDGADAPDTA